MGKQVKLHIKGKFKLLRMHRIKRTLTGKTIAEKWQDDNYKFMPDLQRSQPCETMFRQARSFSSMFSPVVVVNFNMMEFINRMNKIQLQSDIIKTYSSHIKFPRFEEKQQRSTTNEPQTSLVLNKNEIKMQIEKARLEVLNDLKKFGIDTKNLNFCCQVNPTNFNEFNYDDIDDDESSENWSEDHEPVDYMENADANEEYCT